MGSRHLQDAVIINLEAFLQPGFRVRDVELEQEGVNGWKQALNR